MLPGSLSARRGNEIEADAWRNKAREVIDYIAGHAGSEELRQAFLNQPDVREIMSLT